MKALKLTPYPAYKTSGVERLGDIPVHWEVRRLQNVADMRVSNVDKHVKADEKPIRLCNYVDVYKNDYINEQINFMRATATTDEIERFRLETDDVLITKDSESWDDIGVPALVTETAPDLISGYHLALLRPRPDQVTGGYLFRTLQSNGLAYQFHIEAKGVTRYGLSRGGIKSVRVPVPPSSEQNAVARYLNHATERIHRYISAKERLINLLEEQRQAVIHRAVTRGLDPDIRLKPSRVEWLGDVPMHWEVWRLKHAATLNPSRAESRSSLKPATAVTFLPMERVRSDGRIDSQEIIPASKVWNSFTYFRRNDVLVAKITPCFENGKGAHLRSLPTEIGFGSTEFHVLRAKSFVLPQFLYLLTKTSDFRRLGADAMTGAAGQQRVPPSFLANYSIPLPPLAEQTTIVEYLEKATTDIDAAASRARRQIDLLKEYRTRVIADVVTGKLDVREAAFKLPEEPDELSFPTKRMMHPRRR
ncbi:MAG: restriction endonuclease subunit S [Gammaproteobacteria bacterium]|nr:restriction endonuclease subunit S [Gammaproteobacteria bacterium]